MTKNGDLSLTFFCERFVIYRKGLGLLYGLHHFALGRKGMLENDPFYAAGTGRGRRG